ncbi:MFS transporter [Catellatospora vulcania]|uniref:MFS transporter n=1 Tax=Catellatospora vulcania TaxID=1460450 RepID=UPI0018AF5C8C|nr:MFS transporter [Catellatospora vulcania]
MTAYPLLDQLGLPRTRGNGRLLAALAVDALGNGLFAPFLLLFLSQWTGASLAVVGAAVTLARLVALPLGVLAGPLTDRLGPQPTLVASGLLQAAGMGGFLLAADVWQIAVCALLAAVGDAAFWVAIRSMTAAVVDVPDRPRWLAAQIALRNASFAAGGLTAALAATAPGPRVLPALAAVNAASFVALALLIGTWRPRLIPREQAASVEPGSFRTVLRDRVYLLYVLVNLLLVLCMAIPGLLLAIYVSQVLDGPLWLVGVLFTMETVLIAGLQTVLGRLMEHRRRTAALRWAAVAFAASFAVYAALPGVPGHLVAPGLILAMLAATAANLLEGPSGIGLVTDAAPDHVRGRYTAVYQLSWNIGKALSPGLATWLLARGPAMPWLALIACCAAAYLLLLRLGALLPKRVDLPVAR